MLAKIHSADLMLAIKHATDWMLAKIHSVDWMLAIIHSTDWIIFEICNYKIKICICSVRYKSMFIFGEGSPLHFYH